VWEGCHAAVDKRVERALPESAELPVADLSARGQQQIAKTLTKAGIKRVQLPLEHCSFTPFDADSQGRGTRCTH
jgi:hypothetical protein